MRRLLVLSCMLLAGAEPALAQTDGEIEAYRRGYESGFAACRVTPGCGIIVNGGFDGGAGGVAFNGTAGPGGTAGTSGYVLPEALFPGTGDSIEIPQNWFVTPLQGGQGIVGRVETDGSFSPFVFRPDGSLDLLSDTERPVWAANPDISQQIDALPRGETGLTVVPVQPAHIQ